jgi:hypothetical protein
MNRTYSHAVLIYKFNFSNCLVLLGEEGVTILSVWVTAVSVYSGFCLSVGGKEASW